MKRLFVSWFLCLLVSLVLTASAVAADPAIHVIIAADGRAGFGANLVADYKNMERLFRENVPASRLHIVAMDTSNITPDKVLDAIRGVKLEASDTLVFYYSGHAAHDVNSGGQYLQLRDSAGKSVELRRRILLATLREKKASLTVLLTDCCNMNQKSSLSTETGKDTTPTATPPVSMSPVFDSLFVQPKGVVDITSSKRGEASFVDSTSKKRGSCFTWPLVALLEKHRSNGAITWTVFVDELRVDVQKAFIECWPEGYKFDPPVNGISLQKAQTVDVYGTLPGAAASVANGENRGPRLGVRAVANTGGSGVRVTELFENGPGQRAGFEVGDVILEINGTPVNSEAEYAKAVDLSPKNMQAKVVNVNDGKAITVTFELGY